MNRNAAVPSSAGAEWTSRRVGQCASRLFLYCFLAYTCSYIGRKDLAACLPSMIEEGFLTKPLGGTISSAYMLVYGAGQLISGIVGSRIKPRYMIGTGLCGAGLCNLAMGLTPSAGLMPLIWALNGLFHAMLWAPIIRTFTDLLPVDRKERAGTNISVSCSVGAVLAFLIPGLVLRFANWRVVFYIAGGILLSALLVWVVGNRFLAGYTRMMEEACRLERAAILDRAEAEAAAHHKRVKRSLPAVVIGSGLWVVLFSLLCNGALRDAVESWAPTFLADQFSLDGSIAALISVVIPVVSVTGTYFANWLYAKKLHNELSTVCVMFLIATACVAGLFFCRGFNAILCALFMAVAISAMWGANHMFLTVVPYRFAPLGMSAAVTGLLNSIIYFATALFSALYGVLADRIGWGYMILIWLILGVLGILFSLVFARFWGKKREKLDEGSL